MKEYRKIYKKRSNNMINCPYCNKLYIKLTPSHLKKHNKIREDLFNEHQTIAQINNTNNTIKRNSLNHLTEIDKYIGAKTKDKCWEKYKMV